MHIEIALTPASVTPLRLKGRQAVIIDVLRCTTSMLTALANGARGVIPTRGVTEATELRTKLGASTARMGGERGGMRIENFDLGNSPSEYTRDAVGGRMVVMFTTNGTPPFVNLRFDGPVWIGAFLNLAALARKIGASGQDTLIICAGNDGDFSIEDTLCAGALLRGIETGIGGEVGANDAARVAGTLYDSHKTHLLETVRAGEHARKLTKLGYGGDIDYAMRRDTLALTPRLNSDGIVASASQSTVAVS